MESRKLATILLALVLAATGVQALQADLPATGRDAPDAPAVDEPAVLLEIIRRIRADYGLDAEAVAAADVVILALPDESAPAIFDHDVAGMLRSFDYVALHTLLAERSVFDRVLPDEEELARDIVVYRWLTTATLRRRNPLASAGTAAAAASGTSQASISPSEAWPICPVNALP